MRAPLLWLSTVSAAACAVTWWQGWTLWYGDANAHLNIARRIADGRTPGIEQFGTVWLPLPHLLALPLTQMDPLWTSGAGGAIPSALAFVAAGLFLFLSLKRLFEETLPAWAGLLAFTLNPNLLYLQSTPMTESLSLMAVLGVLHFTLRFRESQRWSDAALAGLFALAGTLIRYEGWFLLPFVAGYILWRGGRARVGKTAVFCAVAGAGPLLWLAYNQYFYSNALEFYNGPYSAKAIYARALAAKNAFRYPGDHDWAQAFQQYRAAAVLCAGEPLAWLGLLGGLAALIRRAFWAAFALALVPVFYVLSVYSSGTPVFVPNLWPNSHYNTRYGIHFLPWACLGAAALVRAAPRRMRQIAAISVAAVAVSPWVLYPRKDNWVTWKESQVNSSQRRQWTSEAAEYLKPRYRPRQGIFMSFGDQTGILREAGIPLRESFHEGDGLHWEAAAQKPELFLREAWAIALPGDRVSVAMRRLRERGGNARCVKIVAIEGEPAVEIWRRGSR